MIEDIERIHACLQPEAFRDWEDPAESDIEVNVVGAANGVAPQIAVRAQRIRCKRRRRGILFIVQVLHAGRAAVKAHRVARKDVRQNFIGAVVVAGIDGGQRVVGARNDIDGLAARDVDQRRNLPIAQPAIHKSVAAFQRTGGYKAGVEVVARIKHAGSPIGMPVERLRVGGSGQGSAEIRVGNANRVGVVGIEREAIA